MINYTYEITNLDVDNTTSTPNLIKGVHVVLTATDDTDGVSDSIGIYIGLQPSETFVPFENMTKEIVESWIKDSSVIENAKPLLVKKIEDKRAAAVVKTAAPPWIVPVATVPRASVVDTNIANVSTPRTIVPIVVTPTVL